MPREKKKSAPVNRFPWLLALSLFALVVITYIPSMTNGFIWDDPQYVVDNPTLKSAEGLWEIWTNPAATPQYYPMVHTTFWIESQLWGTENATGFHVDNILLHALAAVLLWRALVGLEIPAAFLAAAIFAVHPVMVESVAWVTERKNVLSIVFYLLAFQAYHRSGFMDHPAPVSEVPPRAGFARRWYVASLSLFLLALLSKTVTCSLPAAILLIIWWKRGTITWRDVKPMVPMLIAGLALSALTSHLEHTHVGASGKDFNWSIIDRCLIAGHAICFYGLKLIWPNPLIFMYPKWDLHLHRALQLGYPLIVIWLVAMLWLMRRQIGRGPLVAVLFFIGTLVPALGFVNVFPMRYSFVADHFQYLASIGIITLIAAFLQRILFRQKWVLAVVILPLFAISARQQLHYKDAKTLWTDTIHQNPNCWMAHSNLAHALDAEKNTSASMAEFQLALSLAPDEAETHYDMGVAFGRRGQWQLAVDQFKQAIQIDPGYAPAWADLAQILFEDFGTPQDQADALADAQKALEIQPALGDAHYVLGRIAEVQGNFSKAIDEYGKALLANPKNFSAHYNLGNCLLQTGRPGEAAGEYQKVLAHDPRDAFAWTNMGYACLSAGKLSQAAGCFQNALALKPDLAAAHEGLKKAAP